MKHVLELGKNKTLFITLHGTGGHATQLFSIANMIDEDATLLGIEGDVVENGYKRYFERHQDGSYNLESLEAKTTQLYEAIQKLVKEHNLDSYDIYTLGYSNGANMIVNMLKRFNLNMKGHIIFHPAIMNMEDDYITQNESNAYITSGLQDPYFSTEALELMTSKMKDANIDVSGFMSDFGHQLVQEEITGAKDWYNTHVRA